MIQIKYVNNTTAIGRHSHKRIIHRRQIETTDTIGEHHDPHDIYSEQIVSFFRGCEFFSSIRKRARESFATSASAKHKPVHCFMFFQGTTDACLQCMLDAQVMIPSSVQAALVSARISLSCWQQRFMTLPAFQHSARRMRAWRTSRSQTLSPMDRSTWTVDTLQSVNETTRME